MRSWDLTAADVRPHHPVVLDSVDGAARLVLLNLPAGEELQEHEVHEHTWLHVHSGAVEVEEQGQRTPGGAGALFHWDPHERRAVRAIEDALVLMVLAPWPGPGHPNTRAAAAARAG